MSYLQINGYPIRVRTGQNLSHEDIASYRQYSFNGRYQYSRNAVGRRWGITTAVLPGDEVMALTQMLKMRGDAWRWDLNTDPNGVHYIADDEDPEGWSDKRRVPQVLEAKATVVSAYGADGSRVYDWNGNPYAPFSGCEGALLVDAGTENLLTGTQYHPTTNGHLTNQGGATHAADSGRYWTQSGSVAVNMPTAPDGSPAPDGVRASLTVSASTDYVFSIYVKGHVGGEKVRLRVEDGTSTFIEDESYTLSTDTDRWQRLKIAWTQTANTTARVELRSQDTVEIDVSIDGLQVEEDPGDGYPSAPIDPDENPFGDGASIRGAGVLDFDQWMSGFVGGFTVSAWVNVQYLGASTTRILIGSGDGDPQFEIYINTLDALVFIIRNATSSFLNASHTLTTTGWKHVAAVYSAKARTAYLYLNGSLVATDSTWTGSRQFFDIAKMSGDWSIGSTGSAGTNILGIPLGPLQVLPFAAPAHFVSGLYASGADQLAAPGLMPLAIQGDILGSSEEAVYCYAHNVRTRGIPHKSPITGNWESTGAEVSFELVEATAR